MLGRVGRIYLFQLRFVNRGPRSNSVQIHVPINANFFHHLSMKRTISTVNTGTDSVPQVGGRVDARSSAWAPPLKGPPMDPARPAGSEPKEGAHADRRGRSRLLHALEPRPRSPSGPADEIRRAQTG